MIVYIFVCIYVLCMQCILHSVYTVYDCYKQIDY